MLAVLFVDNDPHRIEEMQRVAEGLCAELESSTADGDKRIKFQAYYSMSYRREYAHESVSWYDKLINTRPVLEWLNEGVVFDIVITDLNFHRTDGDAIRTGSERDGLNIIDELRARNPLVIWMLVTGYESTLTLDEWSPWVREATDLRQIYSRAGGDLPELKARLLWMLNEARRVKEGEIHYNIYVWRSPSREMVAIIENVWTGEEIKINLMDAPPSWVLWELVKEAALDEPSRKTSFALKEAMEESGILMAREIEVVQKVRYLRADKIMAAQENGSSCMSPAPRHECGENATGYDAELAICPFCVINHKKRGASGGYLLMAKVVKMEDGVGDLERAADEWRRESKNDAQLSVTGRT